MSASTPASSALRGRRLDAPDPPLVIAGGVGQAGRVGARVARIALAAALALGAGGSGAGVRSIGPGERVRAEHVWPIEFWLDHRLVDGQPQWPRRLLEKLALANRDLQTVNHPLDSGCAVEIAVASARVYRAWEDGLIEGGTLTVPARGSQPAHPEHRMPHDTLERPSARRFEPTRMYLSPGPGWAHARPEHNAAYGWVGSWKPGVGNGRGGGSEGLIDPWGRPGSFVFLHELGHVAGLSHRVVRRPEECSLMSYGAEMFPRGSQQELCPENGVRFTADQCERWVAKARAARTRIPPREDVYRDGRIDHQDLDAVRRIASGRPEPDHLTACLGWQSKGPCRLFPIGDADGDLDVDAEDVERVERALASGG
jgi:hypothetical protein